MGNSAALALVLSITGIVMLSVLFSSAKTGLALSELCPAGSHHVIQSVPGGGNQVIDCVKNPVIQGWGNTFDTYSAHPAGDLRRQAIAQYGFDEQHK